MKKVLIALMFLPLIICGCGNHDYVKENMSEITDLYFVGDKDGDYASISVGKREEPYVKDGYSQNKCDFALLCLNISTQYENMRLSAVIKINEEKHNILLEMVGGTYMFDLERKLNAEDKLSLSYGDKTIEFTNKGKEFGIDQEKALEIGKEQLKSQIKGYSKGRFEAECYLRVLGKETKEFNELFWCFTLVGRDEKVYNCIFSVSDGTIIALS